MGSHEEGVGLYSIDSSYHFFRAHGKSKLVPFIEGGYTRAFGNYGVTLSHYPKTSSTLVAASTTGFSNGLACDWSSETSLLNVLFSLSRINIGGFVSVWRYVNDCRR